jgi:hypothetical protein
MSVIAEHYKTLSTFWFHLIWSLNARFVMSFPIYSAPFQLPSWVEVHFISQFQCKCNPVSFTEVILAVSVLWPKFAPSSTFKHFRRVWKMSRLHENLMLVPHLAECSGNATRTVYVPWVSKVFTVDMWLWVLQFHLVVTTAKIGVSNERDVEGVGGSSGRRLVL